MFLEKDKKRLLRRNNKEKIKRKALKILKRNYIYSDNEITPKNIGQFAISPKSCSCSMCSKNRKQGNITLKERSFLEINIEEEKDLYYSK